MPWENCLVTPDFNLFKSYITSSFNKPAPLKEQKVRGKDCPWLTREIKQLINSRDYYLKRFKKSNNDSDWNNYKNLRNSVTSKIRIGKANSVRRVLKETSDKPNSFWKSIKKCYPTNDTTSASKTFIINDTAVFNKGTIANAFCSFFSKVGSSLMKSSFINYTWASFNHRKYMSAINPNNNQFKFSPVYIGDVIKILMNLKTSKASGVDGIPASLIKDTAHELAAPLPFMINRSLQCGIFPTCKKMAKITPLFKSGAQTNIDNYRPISVLNILSKVVERVAYNQISNYLENHHCLVCISLVSSVKDPLVMQ
jgi:hypothetical protein